jgi:hypothetical protein
MVLVGRGVLVGGSGDGVSVGEGGVFEGLGVFDG